MNSELSEEEHKAAHEGQPGVVRVLGWFALLALVFGSLFLANYLRPELIDKKELAALGYTVLEEKVPLQDLPAFRDSMGNAVDISLFQDRWTLVFFGFTFCPDVCPTTLAILNRVVGMIDDDAPRVVFVTLDPARDTRDLLAQYVSAFNPDFIALRGDERETKAFATLLQVVYAGQNESGNYLIDHSTHIAAISPDAVFSGLFRVPHQEDRMAKVLRLLQ